MLQDRSVIEAPHPEAEVVAQRRPTGLLATAEQTTIAAPSLDRWLSRHHYLLSFPAQPGQQEHAGAPTAP